VAVGENPNPNAFASELCGSGQVAEDFHERIHNGLSPRGFLEEPKYDEVLPKIPTFFYLGEFMIIQRLVFIQC